MKTDTAQLQNNIGEAEELPTQLNVEKNPDNLNSSELLKREKINNTPFEIVTTDMGSFVAMGRIKITELQSEEKCREDIFERDYMLLINLIGGMIEFNKITE